MILKLLPAVLCCVLAVWPLSSTAQTDAPLTLTRDQQALILWNEALARMAANRPRAAIELLEPLVSDLPGLTRIRLELARAYFLTAEDDKARFHFERALGDPLSEPDRVAVQEYLDAIDARKFWEASLSVSVINETNPGQRTDAETINIGGLPFTLSDTAEDSTGIETRIGLGVLPPLTRDVSGRLVLTFQDQSFENDAFDDRTLGAEAGFVFRADGGAQFGLGALISDRKLAGASFSESEGFYADTSVLAGPATRLSFRATMIETTHNTLTSRNGRTHAVQLGVTHILNSQTALRGSLSFSDIDAAADWERGQTVGLSLGGSYSFAGGITVEADVGITSETRDAAAPLFTEPRDDLGRFVAVRALYRGFDIQGFTPVLGVRYDTRSSPLTLFDYDNLGLTLGFTRLF